MSSQQPDYEVLICTYNGAAYISEQLLSILKQQPAPIRILISDDGSTDATLSIVKHIALSTNTPITIIHGPQQGIISNVLSALPHSQAEYVLLADQDDIWLPEKASLFCKEMQFISTPHLIFSDALIWDPETNTRTSFWKKDQLNPDNSQDPRRLAFHNCVQGASSAVNQALIKHIKTHPDIAMHDWWFGLIASATGITTAILQPTLLYRQHANNQIGSRYYTRKKPATLADKKAKAEAVLKQACAFSACYSNLINDGNSLFFSDFQKAMGENFLIKLKFLLHYRPMRKNLLRTSTLWASILCIRLSRKNKEHIH